MINIRIDQWNLPVEQDAPPRSRRPLLRPLLWHQTRYPPATHKQLVRQLQSFFYQSLKMKKPLIYWRKIQPRNCSSPVLKLKPKKYVNEQWTLQKERLGVLGLPRNIQQTGSGFVQCLLPIGHVSGSVYNWKLYILHRILLYNLL